MKTHKAWMPLLLATLLPAHCAEHATASETEATLSRPLILDMVSHNPDCPPYISAYNYPSVIREMGFNGKVYSLFESPGLAIHWESVSPDILPPGSKERDWVDTKAAEIRTTIQACKAAGIGILFMSDLVLFPKRLIEHHGIQDTFGDPRHPTTQNLLQKDESIALWREIVDLAKAIEWPNERERGHAIGSCYYGLRLYEIQRNLVYLEDAAHRNDLEAMRKWLLAYDASWETYHKLPTEFPDLATLYTRDFERHIHIPAEDQIRKIRARLAEAPE